MVVVAGQYINEVEDALRTSRLQVDLLDKGPELLLISPTYGEEQALMEVLEDVGIHYIQR